MRIELEKIPEDVLVGRQIVRLNSPFAYVERVLFDTLITAGVLFGLTATEIITEIGDDPLSLPNLIVALVSEIALLTDSFFVTPLYEGRRARRIQVVNQQTPQELPPQNIP